ncbi:SIS domain-containing protein [Marinimicrobium sp. ARAG 43.8]|uniref:SIS domain-containing protein n=1 Tax=Marinimicrobium sp. ARAG 43.8 TaxID=3418719 RepID=UPI003CEE5EBC
MTTQRPQTAPKPEDTRMFKEAAEAASVVRRQFAANAERVREAAGKIREYKPRAVVTCARGSSDHACTYAKYLIETQIGLITASAAPSVGSVYQRPQQLDGVLYIAISQSGKSPDLLANVERAKAAGALTLALVNVEDSPLAELADLVLPLHAGPELSVAATKSYIASLAALLQLVTEWSDSERLKAVVGTLPDALAQAWELDWSTAVETLTPVRNLFVIGRGIGFGIAQEAALKLKETCGLHAEAFSSAEVKHGPMAIVDRDFPVLVISQPDETLQGMESLAEEFRQRGARVMMASEASSSDQLPVVPSSHPLVAPILAIQSFYRMANALSIARGYHPDEPPHLNKVTETV